MHSARLLALALLVVVASTNPCLSDVTCDHFNYGPLFCPLTGLNGGQNWGGAWAGYDNLSPAYSPDAGLTYTASCYTNVGECNDPANGGTVHQSYRGAPRAFPYPLMGDVWVSALVRLGYNDSFRGFTFSNNELTFGFGFNPECQLYAYFAGCDTLQGPVVHSAEDTHLVIALVQVNYDAAGTDRVSVWADPEDTCGGPSGLGAPDVTLGDCDVIDDWDTLMFELGNGSNLDAIRISHGAGASLAEILECPPTSPVEESNWGTVKALFR
jgi:hypothetical protein